MNREHFVTFCGFDKTGKTQTEEEVTVYLKEPIELFETDPHGQYAHIKGVARSKFKKKACLHPCHAMKGWHFEPRDWSESIDKLAGVGA